MEKQDCKSIIPELKANGVKKFGEENYMKIMRETNDKLNRLEPQFRIDLEERNT